MFLHLSVILLTGGGVRGCSREQGCVCGCLGGCAWLLGGHLWLLPGGHVWLLGGACMVALGRCVVAPGGMHGCSGGGMHGCSGGGQGCAWFFQGGMRGFSWGACMVFSGGVCIGYDEIRSMSGRYTSYWNAFLLYLVFTVTCYMSHFKLNSKMTTDYSRPYNLVIPKLKLCQI